MPPATRAKAATPSRRCPDGRSLRGCQGKTRRPRRRRRLRPTSSWLNARFGSGRHWFATDAIECDRFFQRQPSETGQPAERVLRLRAQLIEMHEDVRDAEIAKRSNGFFARKTGQPLVMEHV